MSTSIGGGAVFFGEEVAAGWERRLAVAPSSSTRCCGGRRVGGGISVAELAGRWYVTVGLVTVITAVVGGAVSRRRVVGIGAGFLFLTARACRSVGWSSRKVSSTFTCFIPEARVQMVLPLKSKLFKAFTKVAGSV